MALNRPGEANAERMCRSFNGRMRVELLNETMFRNLAHARVVIAAWPQDYNTERPHSALDYQTPSDFARTLNPAMARPAARDESSERRAIAHTTQTSEKPAGLYCRWINVQWQVTPTIVLLTLPSPLAHSG